MTIRVLHVVDHLGYGGAPLVVKNIVEGMPTDRIESLVCALRPNQRPMGIDAPVLTLNCRKYSPATVRAIARLCGEHRIDIIHAHLQKAFISSLLATYFCSIAVVLHEHGPIFRGGTGSLYRLSLKLLGRRAGAIIANSQATKTAIEQTLGHGGVPIDVVPNFIDLQRYDPARYDRSSVRKNLGLDDGTFLVGFVGRLDRAKGADLLVEAAAHLGDERTAYRFLLVGDGPERGSLEERVRRLGLEETVRFHGLSENPAEVMTAFDVAVAPSRREAFGIAVLEAMRMKAPVLVSPVGGLPELTQHGTTGLVLAQNTPADIAASLRQLRADEPLRRRLVEAASRQVDALDNRKPIEQIVNIYKRMTGSGRDHTDHV